MEIADFFGVNVDTLFEWRGKHPEFSEAVLSGRTGADAKVAEKMYQRAIGYEHKSVKIFMPAGAGEPVYAKYTEHYPPDTTAASWWLKNRHPDKWRDRKELTGKGGKDLIPDGSGGPVERAALALVDLMSAPLALVPASKPKAGRREVTEDDDGSDTL